MPPTLRDNWRLRDNWSVNLDNVSGDTAGVDPRVRTGIFQGFQCEEAGAETFA